MSSLDMNRLAEIADDEGIDTTALQGSPEIVGCLIMDVTEDVHIRQEMGDILCRLGWGIWVVERRGVNEEWEWIGYLPAFGENIPDLPSIRALGGGGEGFLRYYPLSQEGQEETRYTE